jgi:penicillin-binding protein 1A
MAESDNTVFVQLAADVGLNDVVETAEDLGITSPVDLYPSPAARGSLGTGVSPLDMAKAYSTFAGAGIHREPYSIESIDRNSYGQRGTVYDHEIGGRRAFSGNEAAVETQVLRGVVEDGTATMFHDLYGEIGHPSAGKRGTTDDFADAWYVGYTPRLCTSVWVGYPEGRKPWLTSTAYSGRTAKPSPWTSGQTTWQRPRSATFRSNSPRPTRATWMS